MTVTLDIGSLRQSLTLSGAASTSPDGDGGFVPTYAPLSPATWRAALESVGATSTRRAFADTVIAMATHVFRGRYHPGITTQSRLAWRDRSGVQHTANVLGAVDLEGAGVVSLVLAAEIKS